MNIWISALIVVCAIFAVLGINAVIRGIVRTREPRETAVHQDSHTFAVPGLGTTMADGGQSQDEPRDRK